MSSVRFAPIASARVFGRRSESETSTANRRSTCRRRGSRPGRRCVPRRREQRERVAVRREVVQRTEDRVLPGRTARRCLRRQRLQRRQAGCCRHRRERSVRMVELGSGDDGEPVQVGDRHQPRRHRGHGPSGRRGPEAVGDQSRVEGNHRHEPEHGVADALPRLPGEGLRVRGPEPLQLGRPTRRVGRLPAAPEEGRSGDGLGAPVPAHPRPAHEGSDRRPEEGRAQGRLHRDQQADERRPGRRHPDLHCVRQLAS